MSGNLSIQQGHLNEVVTCSTPETPSSLPCAEKVKGIIQQDALTQAVPSATQTLSSKVTTSSASMDEALKVLMLLLGALAFILPTIVIVCIGR